jgi:phage terminase large subunit-like protein
MRSDSKNPAPHRQMRISAQQMAKYRGSPVAFFEEIMVRSQRGLVPLGTIMAPHQREWLTALSPALLGVAMGQTPPIGKFFWEGTKGSGKDFCLALAIIWLFMASGRSLYCQIGAADKDQADELRKSAKGILRLNPWLDRIEVNSWKIKCETSDCECDIVAADIAGSHGARPDVLVLNELHAIDEGKWEFAENLLDNASKVPNGLVVIATNAGFTGTDAFRWREMARTSPRWSFHQYAQPAPWLNAAEIQEAQTRNSAQRFNRLFMGQWSSGAGDALDPQDIAAAVNQAGPLVGRELEAGWTFIGGLDVGIKHDHSAFVVLGVRHGEGRVRLAWIQNWKPPRGGQVDLQAVEEHILNTHSRMYLHKLLYDPHQAQHLAQRLRRRGVLCEEVPFVGAHLDRMATVLMECFRTRIIDLYGDKQLIKDLGRITIEEKPYGQRLTAVADADGHADTATALAIALPTAQRFTFSGRRTTAKETESRNIQAPNGRRFVPTTKRHNLRQSFMPWVLGTGREDLEFAD